MRQRLKLLAGFAAFWVALQIILRAFFLTYNADRTSALNGGEVFLVFWNGLRMDISMSGYFIMFAALMFTLSAFVRVKWLAPLLNAIFYFAIFLSCLIAVVDAELYRHWGFRMDTTPLFYLSGAEAEAFGSVDAWVVVKLILIFAVLVAASFFGYGRWLAPPLRFLPQLPKWHALTWLCITALCIIPIRGSFTVAPMNTGFVYFHKTKSFANHAAINVVWNFLYTVTKGEGNYPEDFYDKDLARSAFRSLYENGDTTIQVLSNPKPNVILFILESFTADVIEPLGGREGVTPNLNALCDEGILFTNFYSSGDRTDKGLISILSGYPAQTRTSIIKSPAKSQYLPNLIHRMNALGYHTSFVYGGDPDFANFRSYLTHSNFARLTTQEDFPDATATGKWGVHDHLVFDRAFAECDTAANPFFKVILSLSSHEPFDVPMEPVFAGDDPESLFFNACNYTDKHLGDFIQRAKASAWWDNTVVIMVADHGHRLPGNKELTARERFRIPLLLTGGAVKGDSVIHTIGNQTDIATTLLAQLGAATTPFRFSKNLFSPTAKSFAAYFFNNGYGFVTDETWVVYDHNAKRFVINEGATPADLNLSKAYQQVLYSDYNSK